MRRYARRLDGRDRVERRLGEEHAASIAATGDNGEPTVTMHGVHSVPPVGPTFDQSLRITRQQIGERTDRANRIIQLHQQPRPDRD